MSQITRDINKITGTIIGISGKLVVYALIILLLVEGVSKGYEFGYEIFYAVSVDQPPGKDITITIHEGASAGEVAGDLQKLGLIKNRYTLMIQQHLYEYDINPGTYELNTSMTSEEMLLLFHEVPEEHEDDTEVMP